MQEDELCKGVIEKLIVSQLIKKFLVFYVSRRATIFFTIICHWTLFWAKRIQSTYSDTTSCRLGFNKLHPYNKYLFIYNVFKDGIGNSNNVNSRG